MHINPIRKNLAILGRIDEAKVDATTEQDIAKHQLQDEMSECSSTSLIRYELDDLIRAIDTKIYMAKLILRVPSPIAKV